MAEPWGGGDSSYTHGTSCIAKGVPGIFRLKTGLEGLPAPGKCNWHSLAAWFDALGSAAWPAVAITLTAMAFVVVLRLLGLVGIVTLARRRQWRPLVVILGAIAYFAMVIPFYGNSRFRVPVEYLFVLLALAGVDGLRRRRKATSPTSMPNRLQSSAE